MVHSGYECVSGHLGWAGDGAGGCWWSGGGGGHGEESKHIKRWLGVPLVQVYSDNSISTFFPNSIFLREIDRSDCVIDHIFGGF